MTYENMADLAEAVRSGSVISLSMELVRDAHGAGRLGKHVRAQISRDLEGYGIGHYPAELPDRQDQQIRLFQRGTPVAELINAVLEPGTLNDQHILSSIDSSTEMVLDQIRALVCD